MYEKFHDKAIRLVYDHVKSTGHAPQRFSKTDVTIVWFCKTLQNWKALVITHIPDAMYYEVTYNGDKHETYIDSYKKFDNVVVPDAPDIRIEGFNTPAIDPAELVRRTRDRLSASWIAA